MKSFLTKSSCDGCFQRGSPSLAQSEAGVMSERRLPCVSSATGSVGRHGLPLRRWRIWLVTGLKKSCSSPSSGTNWRKKATACMGDTPGSSCVMGEAEKQTDPSLDKAIDTSNLLAIQGFHFLFRCQIRLFVRWGISITNALGAQQPSSREAH